MIEVMELTKQFGMTLALDHLSFRMEKGEILGFLGPNGAGKTTTMRILTGFLAPTSGSAKVADIDIGMNSYAARKKIGYLPESVPLYRDMKIMDYLYFVASIKGVPRHQRHEHIQRVTEQCGLSREKSRIIGVLSKGYRQRVGLAQALIGDPDVLILDEPTEGLDPKQIMEIRHLIKELGNDRTIILSSHILPEVSMICQRVIILNKGKLIAVDTPENLDRTLQKKMNIIIGVRGPEDSVLRTISEIPGIIQVTPLQNPSTDHYATYKIECADETDLRNRIAETVIHHGWELFELHREVMSLEDIFIHLVTQEDSQ